MAVVLTAAPIKPVLARQFVPLDRMHVEEQVATLLTHLGTTHTQVPPTSAVQDGGLLARFLDSLSEDAAARFREAMAHNTFATGKYRFLYRRIGAVYVVLVSQRDANVAEAIALLSLHVGLVRHVCGDAPTRADVVANAFDLVFALDETIVMGAPQALSMSEIQQRIKMHSDKEDAAIELELERAEYGRLYAEWVTYEARQLEAVGGKRDFGGGIGSDMVGAETPPLASGGGPGMSLYSSASTASIIHLDPALGKASLMAPHSHTPPVPARMAPMRVDSTLLLGQGGVAPPGDLAAPAAPSAPASAAVFAAAAAPAVLSLEKHRKRRKAKRGRGMHRALLESISDLHNLG